MKTKIFLSLLLVLFFQLHGIAQNVEFQSPAKYINLPEQDTIIDFFANGEYLLTKNDHVYLARKINADQNSILQLDSFILANKRFNPSIFHLSKYGLLSAEQKDSSVYVTAHFFGESKKKWRAQISTFGKINAIYAVNRHNFLLVGSSYKNENNTDNFILLANAYGVVKWKRKFGGSKGTDSLTDIFLNDDGHIYCAGYVDDLGVENYFAAIYKLDLKGDLLWDFKLGRPDKNTQTQSINEDTDGNIWILCKEDSIMSLHQIVGESIVEKPYYFSFSAEQFSIIYDINPLKEKLIIWVSNDNSNLEP